jgi:acyl-CoA synthetase (NDP forming)
MLAETIRRPAEFLEHAAAARARGKPIVLLHLSRSQAARESAKSHTGALAGDYAVMEAFVRSQNVVLVDTFDELIDTANVLAHYPKPPGGGAGIVTDSGAFKGFALDRCDALGLPLASFNSGTCAVLEATLPEFSAVSNPVDLTAQAAFDYGMYTRSVNALMEDPGVGCVLASIISGGPEAGLKRAASLVDGKIENGKPLVCAFMGGDQPIAPELKPMLARRGVPFFRSPERALGALARVDAHARAAGAPRSRAARIEVSAARLPRGGGVLSEWHGKRALRAAGVRVPRGALAKTLEQARKSAARIGYPIVLKAQAAELAHKTEAGGVILGIADAKALAQAWRRLKANIERTRPELVLDGVLIESMVEPGLEAVVGARRDPSWGPTLMIGLGGIWTEALKDVRFVPAYAGIDEIVHEIRKLRGATLFEGFRGRPPCDVPALADAASRIGALMLATPYLDEIDVNPLIVHAAGEGVIAVDALLVGRSSSPP